MTRKPKSANPIRTIVIDPKARTVTEREVPNGLEEWQAIVGGNIEQVVILPNGDEIYADENGRMHGGTYHWWGLRGQPLALTGSAFIVGIRGSNFAAPRIILAHAQQIVEFFDESEARVRFAAHEQYRRERMAANVAAQEKALGLKPGEMRAMFIDGVFPGDDA